MTSSLARRAALVLALIACGAPAQEARVLFLTHSAGFTHPVVRRAKRAVLAHAERELTRAARGQFAVDCTQDCARINAENLARYEAVVFYTTGELPISEENRKTLLEFIRGGGGFVGTHSATDTFYKWPAYGDLIGGYFDGHPWHEKVNVLVEDEKHPAMRHLGKAFEITDEIYQFRSFDRSKVEVLARLDPESVDIGRGKRDDGDYALAWCRQLGQGRVFYTALGHRPDVWKDRRFQRHLVAGIRWAINDEAALARAPEGATVLFDGKDFAKWRHAGKRELGWRIADGVMEVVPGSGSIMTRESFGSCRIHLEFLIPEGRKGKGNSGVYIQRRYEVQILDSSARARPGKSDCGALYRQRAPDLDAGLALGEWQTYDITFHAPKFDADGKKTANARITVLHNGLVIHDDVELRTKTGAGRPEGPAPLPLLLQDHGSEIRFRNVWIQRLDG